PVPASVIAITCAALGKTGLPVLPENSPCFHRQFHRCETQGVADSIAREALRLAAMKLPVKTRTVVREDW
ncbi:MAG: hypothetical protein AAF566_11850, partial [Pseudomonadota bacterium]